MINHIRFYRMAQSLAFVALVLFSGCVAEKEAFTDFRTLGKEETVLVGKVEIIPPLSPEEQERSMSFGPYNDKNMFFYALNSAWVVPDENTMVSSDQYDDILINYFGKTFYVKNLSRDVYFIQMVLHMSLTSQGSTSFLFPGAGKVSIRPGEKAVYVGTIRYHRNEYFDLTKVEIKDEYTREKQVFEKKFGRKHRLIKRLVQPVKPRPVKSRGNIKFQPIK